MSIIQPTINIRMAVLDICEVTGWAEQQALSLLCERLDQGFMNRLNLDIDAIYFEHEQYKLPARQALTFLSLIKKGVLDWGHPINEAVDRYGRTSPDSIPFEQFSLTPRDLYLIVDRIVDFDKFDLSTKWSIDTPYNESRIKGRDGLVTTPKEMTKKAIKALFNRLTSKQWEHFFERETELKEALRGKCRRENLYSLPVVIQWLLKTGEGGYTPNDIANLTSIQRQEKKPRTIPIGRG